MGNGCIGRGAHDTWMPRIRRPSSRASGLLKTLTARPPRSPVIFYQLCVLCYPVTAFCIVRRTDRVTVRSFNMLLNYLKLSVKSQTLTSYTASTKLSYSSWIQPSPTIDNRNLCFPLVSSHFSPHGPWD